MSKVDRVVSERRDVVEQKWRRLWAGIVIGSGSATCEQGTFFGRPISLEAAWSAAEPMSGT